MKNFPLESYICRDSDGLYCLPAQYKHSLPDILFGSVSEELTKLAMKEHSHGGDIFHAGAYIGDFFPFLSSALEPGRQCVTCEPSPLTYDAATMTLRLNQIGNVSCQQKALSDAPGVIEIQTVDEDGYDLAQTTRFIKNRPAGSGLEVQTDTIDNLCSDLEIKILHLDLEGFEFKALQGAQKTLQRENIIVIIENYQQNLVTEFLSDFDCIGTANHNYFFSRKPLEGMHTSLIKANYLEEKGEQGEALKLVTSILQANPDSVQTAEVLMGMYFRCDTLGQVEKNTVISDLAESIIDRQPTKVSSYEYLYRLFSKGYRAENLLEMLRIGVEKSGHPNCAYSFITVGLDRQLDLDQLSGIAISVQEEFFRHPEMALVLSKVMERKGNFARAVHAMEQAVALRPDRENFRERLARLKTKQ